MNRSSRNRLARLLGALIESAWFSYTAIALLQLKVMLWIWKYRDLTPGDASYYYLKVFSWLDDARGDFIWSPLYTSFLAALHKLIQDPFLVQITAQIIIAVSASILVLALLRRLLPGYIAWIIAAWWALLPINFDTVYSVHLHSALFPLVVFVVAASCRNIYCRGIVLAGLLLTAVLVRNEYTLLFIIWLFAFAGYEIYALRQKGRSAELKTYMLGYGLPLLGVLLIIGAFYARAAPQYPELKNHIAAKRTLFVCQNYAYNRKQQGDAWNGNPWTQCRELVDRDFGRPSVTFSQAFFLNPARILQHIWWNIKLIPSGTQLALFNHYAGGPNPDFMPAQKSSLVWIPFLLVSGLGTYAAISSIRKYLIRKNPQRDTILAWLLMFSGALVVMAVILMVRPRPSYMFPYTMFIMALSGLGLHRFFELIRLNNIVKMLVPAAAILLLLFLPSWYDADYVNHFNYKGQPWRDTYDRIAPHINRGPISSPAAVIIPAGNYESLCNYLGVECRTPAPAGHISISELNELIATFPEEDIYLLYLEDMIWKINPIEDQDKNKTLGYVELNCFSVSNDIMTCSDGTIDLNQGLMNDGTNNIPLNEAFFVNNGYITNQINYRSGAQYYLQTLLRNNRIYLILVADERLHKFYFNQQFLLGNYDRRHYQEIYNNFPTARIFKVKKQ